MSILREGAASNSWRSVLRFMPRNSMACGLACSCEKPNMGLREEVTTVITCLDERKSTQMAAWLLEKTNGRMKYLKLIKLLYITDREALRKWGQPLTGDSYYSLPHGPIVSRIQDLITDDPEFSESTYWCDFIKREDYDVVLTSVPKYDRLSEGEIELLRMVFDQYGSMSRWDLRDLTHEFPEWKNPDRGSIPISYEDILEAVGRENEAAEIASDIEADNFVFNLLEG